MTGHSLCLIYKKQSSFPTTLPERWYASFTRWPQIKIAVDHEKGIIMCFTTKSAIKTHQSVGICDGEVMLFFGSWVVVWLVVRFPQFEL